MKNFVEMKLGEKDIKVFLSDKLTATSTHNTIVHHHKYSEIHIITSGKMRYEIEGEEIIAEAGSALLIPAKKFHNLSALEEKTAFAAFQIDSNFSSYKYELLPIDVFKGFLTAINSGELEISNAIPYIYLIIERLLSNHIIEIKKNEDYTYLMYEFFSDNYDKCITLSDLAKILHVSTKQAQRIIKKETGNTFLKELTLYRMKIADYFINTSDMSLSEISQYVGYTSYSGFWKAYNKYRQNL